MSPYVTQYIFWSFTSGGAEMFMPDGMDVYLRCFRLHSAGVICVYLRWLLQSCLHYSAQDLGHLPAVLQRHLPPVGQRYLCLTAWDVYLRCFSPTLGESMFVYTSGGSCGCACQYRTLIGSFTCGATNIYLWW